MIIDCSTLIDNYVFDFVVFNAILLFNNHVNKINEMIKILRHIVHYKNLLIVH